MNQLEDFAPDAHLEMAYEDRFHVEDLDDDPGFWDGDEPFDDEFDDEFEDDEV